MGVTLGIVVSYVVCLLLIGVWASQLLKRSNEGFFLAGRQLPAPLVAVTVTGLAIGGASTIGVAQDAFSGKGISAGWYGVAWSISALAVGLVVSRQYRRLNVVTVPQMFEDYYDRWGRLACVVVQVLVQIVITSLQYVAGGAILHQLLPGIFRTQESGMVFSAIVFIAMTIVGGLWSASLSNILNVILIYGGIALAAVLSVGAAGGMPNIVERLPAGAPYLEPVAGVGWMWILTMSLVLVTCNISFQATIQIGFAAKDESHARRGFLLAALLILPVSFMAAMIGVAAKASFPEMEHAAAALPRMVGSLHPVVAGVTLAALWAADVSTACGLLLSSSTVVTRDVVARLLRRQLSERAQLRMSRMVVLVVGAVTLGLALRIHDILPALMQGLSLTTGPTVVVLFTFLCPALCRRSSALWTIVAGVAVMIFWHLYQPARVTPHVIYLEWIVCVAVFLAVSLFDRRSIPIR
jgi:solute:Na+ symporter, SSS family